MLSTCSTTKLHSEPWLCLLMQLRRGDLRLLKWRQHVTQRRKYVLALSTEGSTWLTNPARFQFPGDNLLFAREQTTELLRSTLKRNPSWEENLWGDCGACERAFLSGIRTGFRVSTGSWRGWELREGGLLLCSSHTDLDRFRLTGWQHTPSGPIKCNYLKPRIPLLDVTFYFLQRYSQSVTYDRSPAHKQTTRLLHMLR